MELTIEHSDAVVKPSGQAWVTSRADGTFGPSARPPGFHWLKVKNRSLVPAGTRAQRFVLDAARPDPQIDVVVLAEDQMPVISGLVVDAAGMPVAAATVTHGWSDSSTRTGPDGTFRLLLQLAADPATPLPLGVWASQFERAETGPIAPGTKGVRIVLRAAAALVVRVREAGTGEPVTAFALEILAAHNRSPGLYRTLPRQAWPAGEARTSGIPRGPYVVWVDPGARRLAPSSFVPVTVGAEATAEVVVELTAWAERDLQLRTASGAPVNGAAVELCDPAGTELLLGTEAFAMAAWRELEGPSKVVLLQAGTTDADGRLALRGPAGRNLALRLRGPGLALQTVQPVRLDGAGPLAVTGHQEAIFQGRLLPTAIAAELFAASQPAPNQPTKRTTFGITLSRAPNEELRRYFEPLFPCDSNGNFRIEGLPPGTWGVTLYALGFQYYCAEVTLCAGQTTQQDLDVTPLRPCEVELQIYLNGAPLANGRVNAMGEHVANLAGRPVRTQSILRADASGAVHFRTFAGTLGCDINPSEGGMVSTQRFTVPGTATFRHVLEVRTGGVALRLLRPDGTPAADLPVMLVGPVHFDQTTTADPDGRVALRPLPVGRYTVRTRIRSLCDRQGQNAYATQNGWAALHQAWIEIGTVEVAATTTTTTELRLPAAWDR